MRSIVVRFLTVMVLAFAPGFAMAASQPSPQLIEIDGAIGPPMASYVARTLDVAAEKNAPFVVIRLDTPGGLSSSMRDIIQNLLDAPMPVVCWVGPKGARAASAGTYILYACGLASMAPGTNIGAATPVQISGLGGSKTPAEPKTAEQQKILNDAIAYITSLAQMRGRNVAWAEKAVREGASLSAKNALEKNVINLMAPNLPTLLDKLDGHSIATSHGTVVLHSANASLNALEPNWKEQFLAVLATPTIAYILLMIGIYGLILEGLHPGAIVPGTVGAIALILALFALHALPISWAGFALIILGAILMVSEGFVPSFGALGLGGLVAFVIGSILLFDSNAPGYTLPAVYIGSGGFVAALGLGTLVYFLAKMRRRPVVSGREHMIGRTAVALADFQESGYVRAEGERWHARSATPVHKGETVNIEAMEDLTLRVRRVDQHEEN